MNMQVHNIDKYTGIDTFSVENIPLYMEAAKNGCVIAFDTETTGLHNHDDIVELGWVVMEKGLIHRYQIITPTAWDISPRDDQNRPGPYEQSIINSKITEPINGDKLTGIDVVRTIHSYDPCLGCTVQIFDPEDQLVATQELSHIHADDVFEREFGSQGKHTH